MRGSVYYQSSILAKIIFSSGAKKKDRINPNHSDYQKIASYNTMETYRNVWNNFFIYLKKNWNIKNFELINQIHISAYMEYKIENNPSKQYLEKINSALGKLEIALKLFSIETHGAIKNYNFSIRQEILDEARYLEILVDNYHHRAYCDPENLISNLSDFMYKIAAKIQYEGGTRIEGIGLIKLNQLRGYKLDKITNIKKGVIFTKEKGGKEGNIFVHINTYKLLENYIASNSFFKIDRLKYTKEIRITALNLGIDPEGSHGLRWNFAKKRMFEYSKAGYDYKQSLEAVSKEMKHNRSYITEHYLGY